MYMSQEPSGLWQSWAITQKIALVIFTGSESVHTHAGPFQNHFSKSQVQITIVKKQTTGFFSYLIISLINNLLHFMIQCNNKNYWHHVGCQWQQTVHHGCYVCFCYYGNKKQQAAGIVLSLLPSGCYQIEVFTGSRSEALNGLLIGLYLPAALGLRKLTPAYLAFAPNSSSMRRIWLYLARRSDRQGAPVLI